MLETFLRTQDSLWPAALAALAPEMHPVDRDATRIWFSFYPLAFHEVVEREGASKDFATIYQVRGTHRLREMVDTSHGFLYAHAYWPEIKAAILNWQGEPGSLAECARKVAGGSDLKLGLALIGLMTLRQTGIEGFGGPLAKTKPPERTPEQVLAARATDAKQGWLRKAVPRVTFREDRPEAWFASLPGQEIATAAELDKRPYQLEDSRCFENMGPIPVECRSGKCGTCWVGVLGGNERMTPMTDWERKRLAYFGYLDAGFERLDDERPLIRLACQATTTGSVSIVIPPWCGVPGRGRTAKGDATLK